MNDNPKDIDMSRNVYADGNLGLFSDTYWDIICSYIDEVLRWDDSFEILSMVADNGKRIVQIKVKIADYDYFKSTFKQFKHKLNTFPINPFTHVQYRNDTITLFLKSEQELIEIEVNNIVDKDFIRDLVYERDYAYNLSQVNYWEEKVRKKKTELYQLESAYYSRNDFENWDYFDESKDEILDSIKLFEEVLSQYYEKMKPKDGCAPF